MQTLRTLSIITVLAVSGPALAQDAPFGNQQDQAYAKTVWTALVNARLAGEDAINTVPYRGVEPHGAMLETFHGTLEVEGNTGRMSVKRNYGPAGVSAEAVQADRAEHLGAVTVMVQRGDYDPKNQNWFWAKYLPDGSLDKAPNGALMAGKVTGCIECHAQAPGDDYLYTTNVSP